MHARLIGPWLVAASLLAAASLPAQELNENCTVTLLNRTAQVDSRGFWQIDNVPANQGPVRSRAICTENGITRFGASEWFVVPANGMVFSTDITFEAVPPIPTKLALTAPRNVLQEIGAALQLSAVISFNDGTSRLVSDFGQGTSYTTSNPRIVTVSPSGLVTATGVGTALVSATNEGTLGLIRIAVSSGPLDSDGDGMGDDWELTYGFNPNDPSDASLDADGDGLSNLNEFNRETDPRNADSDGDGVRDGTEVQTGSDPLDPASFNLSAALRSMTVSPNPLPLVINQAIGDGARLINVSGVLLDGYTIDLTSRLRGTTYSFFPPNIATNSASFDGRIVALANGSTTMTVANSGFTVNVPVTVTTFTQQVVGSVPLGGYANDVAVAGNFAFVATGSAGLKIVNLTTRTVAGTYPTRGNSNDVEVQGTLAYLAEGTGGMQIVDVSVPTSPQAAGWVDTPGVPHDLAVSNGYVYVADRTSGLQIIDARTPGTAAIVANVNLGDTRAVDVRGNLAAVAIAGTIQVAATIQFIDVSNPAAPVVLGSVTAVAEDIRMAANGRVYCSNSSGLTVLDASNPSAPRVAGSGLFGNFRDIAVVEGLVIASDTPSGNGAVVMDVADPAAVTFRSRVSIADVGNGIAADSRFLYAARTFPFVQDFGVTGTSSALHIYEWLRMNDTGVAAPLVRINQPSNGASAPFGATIDVVTEAADDVGVTAVELLLNDQSVAIDSVLPYSVKLPTTAAGTTMNFRARARDAAGNTGTSAVTSVSIVADTQPPILQVVANANPLPGGANSSLTVIATDNAAVTSVEAFLNGVSLGVRTTAPYIFNFTVPNGVNSVTLSARATDPSSNVGTAQVIAPARPNNPPVVTLASPTADMFFYSGPEIQARMPVTDDNNNIQRVELWVNGVKAATGTRSWWITPAFEYEAFYQVPDNLTTITLEAVAFDEGDRMGKSAPVTLNLKPTPAALGAVDLTAISWDVDLRGNIAYVAGGTSGLQVLDVTTPTAPVVIGSLDTPGDARKLIVLGQYAFLGETDGNIRVIDVSTPAAPVSAGSVFTAGTLYDLSVYRDRLYAGTDAGLFIIDISSPTVMRVAKYIPNNPTIKKTATGAVRVHGNLLLDVRKHETFNGTCRQCWVMKISDLSANPDDPVLRGTFGPQVPQHWIGNFEPGDYVGLAAQGNMVYAHGEDWAIAVDITNQAAPVYAGDFDTTWRHFGWKDMDVRGNTGIIAWLEDDRFRVWLSDLRRPADLMMTGSINLSALGPYHGLGLASTHELVYTTGTNDYIFRTPTAGRFYVGRYDVINDIANVAPSSIVVRPAVTTAFGRQAVPVLVTAADDVAVASVTLSVDGVAVETDRTAPYEFLVTTRPSAGSHILVATATDYAGNSAQSAPVTITVNADAVAPSITLTSPLTGASVPTPSARLRAEATDNFSVARVEFFVNNTLVATDTVPPYEHDYAFPSGMLSISAFARAFDPAGNSTDTAAATAQVFTPQLLGSVALPTGYIHNVDMNGDYAYVASGSTMRIVNVAGPPTLVGTLIFPGEPNEVRVHGNYAIVSLTSGLHIVDIRNPSAPALVSTVNQTSVGAAVSGTRIVIGGQPMRVYDFSNPAAPVLVRTIFTSFAMGNVETYGNVVFGGFGTFDNRFGVHAFDMDLTSATNEVFAPVPWIARYTSRNGLFAAATTTGMFTTSVADRLTWVTTVAAERANSLAMADRYIFTGTEDIPARALIFDATNQRDPVQRGQIDWAPFGDYLLEAMTASPTTLVAAANYNSANQVMVAKYRQFTDTRGVAPTVTLAAPAGGKLSRLVALSATAADDVGVKGVVFSVNGVDMYTDTIAPYEFNAMSPANGTSMIVGARAIDYAGTASTTAAATVTLNP